MYYNLKEQGKAGLLYALDFNENYISAENALKGETYYCPVCRCEMARTTTPSGKRIFKRKAGQEHMNAVCYTIETSKIKRSFSKLDPASFITNLCHSVPRKGASRKDSSAQEGNDIRHRENTNNNEEIQQASFSSLKQIHEAGIPFLPASAKQGPHFISDFILTYKNVRSVVSVPGFSLNARIVYGRLLWIDWKSQALVLCMFTGSEFSIRFRLIIPSKKDFSALREKLGDYYEDETGRTKFKLYSDKQDVMIASDDWTFISKNQCSQICSKRDNICVSCSGLYQAIYTNSKQLYIIPSENN